jgi:hypothetical protein
MIQHDRACQYSREKRPGPNRRIQIPSIRAIADCRAAFPFREKSIGNWHTIDSEIATFILTSDEA